MKIKKYEEFLLEFYQYEEQQKAPQTLEELISSSIIRYSSNEIVTKQDKFADYIDIHSGRFFKGFNR